MLWITDQFITVAFLDTNLQVTKCSYWKKCTHRHLFHFMVKCMNKITSCCTQREDREITNLDSFQRHIVSWRLRSNGDVALRDYTVLYHTVVSKMVDWSNGMYFMCVSPSIMGDPFARAVNIPVVPQFAPIQGQRNNKGRDFFFQSIHMPLDFSYQLNQLILERCIYVLQQTNQVQGNQSVITLLCQQMDKFDFGENIGLKDFHDDMVHFKSQIKEVLRFERTDVEFLAAKHAYENLWVIEPGVYYSLFVSTNGINAEHYQLWHNGHPDQVLRAAYNGQFSSFIFTKLKELRVLHSFHRPDNITGRTAVRTILNLR